MEERVIEKSEELIKTILDDGINDNNLDYLYKLSKIKHMAKEDQEMYGNYGNYSGYGARRGGRRESYGEYGNYGEYGEYGARGRGRRYRGDDSLDRMYNEYGRYQESRSYGAGEETDKSYHYMVKALEDFIQVLHEEAETDQQRQMLRETLQRSMM